MDENPPKIDEPAPVAPLEDPAKTTEETKAEEAPAAVEEPTKPIEAAPAASPVVAAAA